MESNKLEYCEHDCTSNCRREGCNCECGEYHEPEHYDAQIKYADLLFKMLDISWLHPIKRWHAFRKAEDVRDSHMSCCEWANEKIYE